MTAAAGKKPERMDRAKKTARKPTKSKAGRPRDYKPLTVADVAEDHPEMLLGNVRAIRREMHEGFELVNKTLRVLAHLDERLIVVIDRQNHIERTVKELMVEQERRYSALEHRVALLEQPEGKPHG